MASLTDSVSGRRVSFLKKKFTRRKRSGNLKKHKRNNPPISLGLWWHPSVLCLQTTVECGNGLPPPHLLTAHLTDNFSFSFLTSQFYPRPASQHGITSTVMLPGGSVSLCDTVPFEQDMEATPHAPFTTSQAASLTSTADRPAPRGCCWDVLHFLLQLPRTCNAFHQDWQHIYI